MGLFSKLFKGVSVLVGLVAIFIGSFFTALPKNLGFFKFLDNLEIRGNKVLKGIAPAVHQGEWQFNYADIPDLTGQKFLVTGANVGLGYWTAYHLASKGGHVIMACRTASKCNSASDAIKTDFPAASLEVQLVDLNSFESIFEFSQNILKAHKFLNSLVLNAGIMRPPYGLTADGIEQQIGVNHFGHFLVAKHLHRLVVVGAKTMQKGSIVVVSSSSHYRTYPEGVRLSLDHLNDEEQYDAANAYGQSKLSNVLFSQELAKRMKKHNVLVNAIHPGAVNTELPRFMFPKSDSAVSQFLKASAEKILWHPKEAALTQVFAAVSPKLFASKTTGKYFHPIARETRPCATHAFNSDMQTGLWKLSEEVIANKVKSTQTPGDWM